MVQPAVRGRLAELETGITGSRRVIAALVIGLGLICIIFLREIQAAIEVWNASTAYSHCYLILPMTMYLLWERRHLLSEVRAAPDLRFVLVAIPMTAFWLVAERLGIMEARQLVVVAGAQLLFLTVLGWRLYVVVSGPLLYLFFLVPFGAFLTPALQQFTAMFSIAGLDLLGIPNFSDGFTIETPAGIFFVAEACAGLRFLIAAVAFGVFYALLSYASFARRLVFIAASIVVPIVANGLRALGIVVLGQVLGSAEAAAADHLIYGWVFFSVVMLMLIAVGHAFRDVDQPLRTGATVTSSSSKRSLSWCVASVVVLLSIGPILARAIDSTLVLPTLPKVSALVIPTGCSSSELGVDGSTDRRSFVVTCGENRFEVYIKAFAARSTSSELISERRRVTQEIGAENAAVSVVDVPNDTGRWTIVQTTDPNRVTAFASWVDGAPVLGGMAGRFAQARDSIFGAAYAPVLITITSAERANSLPGQRKATLDRLTALLRDQVDLTARIAALARLET